MNLFSISIVHLIPHFLFIKSVRGGDQERRHKSLRHILLQPFSLLSLLSFIPVLQESVGLLNFTKPASMLAAKEEGKGKGKERWGVMKPKKV